jgi:hypothetical protein
MNTAKWFSSGLYGFATSQDVILLDFEHFGYGSGAITTKLGEFRAGVEARGSHLGIWANSLVNANSLQIGGVANSTTVATWRTLYNDPSSLFNQAYYSGMHISCSMSYHAKELEGSTLYVTMLQHELSKIARPTVISMPSYWVWAETLDNWPHGQFDMLKPNGQVKTMHKKQEIPASTMYGDALWGMVWDGWHHFETNRLQTDDKAYAFDETADTIIQKKNVRGHQVDAAYKGSYYGFYNYVHLALWQMSQEPYKSIIENSNAWLRPNYNVTNKANVNRTGDATYTASAHLYKEPLIRIKYSADNTKVLFIAQNPYNATTDNVTIGHGAWTVNIVLNGSWPTHGVITV